MYKQIFFILAFVAFCHGFQEEWNMFKKEHNKKYSSEAEEAKRFGIFKDNLKMIRRHNFEADFKKHSYRIGVNHFADLNEEERNIMKGLKSVPVEASNPELRASAPSFAHYKAPDAYDLRTTGCVTRVKNQGQCGSCYTFASAAVLEYLYCKESGKAVSLSEESLMNCSPYVGKCNGGWPTHCFNFARSKGSVATLKSYPYNAKAGVCKFKQSTSLPIKINGYRYVYGGKVEQTMKSVLHKHGPMAVAIYATGKFDYYKSGVYSATDCNGHSINHAVTLIGYGRSKRHGKDYWLIKNSWGTWWGEDGYIRMARNVNMCNVAKYPIYIEGA